MKHAINYSIIIPHKNIPKLLERCLSSIPQRNDLEIIIVDDNSDASFVDFTHFPGEDRSDTKIIFTKENRGGGFARNIGLDNATGKWILFADADDFFNEGFNDILNDYKDSDCDLIFFNANSVDTNTLLPAKRARHVNHFMQEYAKNPTEGIEKLKYLFGEPWSKMIKKSVIDNYCIRFEETQIHNDTVFAYKISYYAKKISVDERFLYCVTARQGSVSVTLNAERIKTRIAVFARANKFYEEHQIPVRWYWLYKQLADLLLTNKKLYKEGLQITQGVGLSLKETKEKVYLALPKSLGRLFMKKIGNGRKGI